ncbi:MAG: mechanosensitive ion channel family protein [PS1 clade bacterium]
MNDFLQNLTPIQLTGILFGATIVIHSFLNLILKQVRRQTKKTANRLDDYIVEAANKPLKALIWFGWFYFSIIAFKGQITYLGNIIEYVGLTPVLIITWGLIRVVAGVETFMVEGESSVDKDSVRLFSRLMKMLIIFAIALGIAQFLGFSISSILTFGGVGGIVMGFAAKDMLSNIFGGLMIQMDKPFSTGDWIRSTDHGIEGVVEKIGWRMTRIRTFTKNPVYIPNSIFATIPIETPSRMTNRRIYEVIGIRYDDIDQMPIIIEEVESLLNGHDKIDHDEPCRVFFDVFNASSLDFVIYAFSNITNSSEFKKMKGKLLLDVASIIAKHGAEIAYPTQTLHIQKAE